MHSSQRLTNQVIQFVNDMRKKENLSFERKSRIVCELSKDLNFMWRTGLITQQLQDIIAENQEMLIVHLLLDTNSV